jgi:hypothetical protein
MTKYLSEERFIVTSNDKDSLRNYKDNYDRIFRQEETPAEASKDNDAIECRLKLHMNIGPAPHVASFPSDVVDTDGRVWRRCEDPECPDLEHPEDLHSHEGPASFPRMSDEAESQHD